MRWPYFRIEVDDQSMLPTYVPGDRLLVRRRGRRLRDGDAVVHADPDDPDRLVVSRVVDARDPTRPMVAGDNPARGQASRDDLGLDRQLILGRVVACTTAVPRPSRRTYT